MNSNNQFVKSVSRMGPYGSYSTFGGNVRWLQYKYDMDVKQIYRQWNDVCSNEIHKDIVRKAEQIKELCQMRERYTNELFTNEEISQIVEYLCTS